MTFARGIQRNINIVILFQLKLLPCRWLYIIDYLCVSLLMQCVHFKGTKCVFDRGNAETTCSKWPEMQITQQDKPYTYCADWLGGLEGKKAQFSGALLVCTSETDIL